MRNFLYGLVLTLIVGLPPTVCPAAGDTPVSDCKQWSLKARKAVESVPWLQRYNMVLEQIAKACPSIPVSLREAAKNSLNQQNKNAFRSKRILLDAAAPYFDPACIPDDPNLPASINARQCKMADVDPDISDFPEYIDSATFFYGFALGREFKKAGIHDEGAWIVVLNLFKSNALLLEMQRNRRKAKTDQ